MWIIIIIDSSLAKCFSKCSFNISNQFLIQSKNCTYKYTQNINHKKILFTKSIYSLNKFMAINSSQPHPPKCSDISVQIMSTTALTTQKYAYSARARPHKINNAAADGLARVIWRKQNRHLISPPTTTTTMTMTCHLK